MAKVPGRPIIVWPQGGPFNPLITTGGLPGGEVGLAYNFTMLAVNGKLPYTWHIDSITPSANGLSINPATGQITGTPATAQVQNVAIRVTDAINLFSVRNYSFTIIAAPAITTASPLPAGTQGAAYSTTIVAALGSGGYVWTIQSQTGTNAWVINSSTGILSGTPGIAETDSITVQVTDSNGVSVQKAFSLQINASIPVITTASLPTATVGSAYNFTMSATSGTPPYVWSVPVGEPAWLSINASTGALTGTPPGVETDSLQIKVTDSLNQSDTNPYTLTVVASGGTSVFHQLILTVPAPSGVTYPAKTGTMKWDIGAAPVGTIDPQWSGGWPSAATDPLGNMQNRDAPFQYSGSATVIGPTPYVSRFLAGNHWGINQGAQGGNGCNFWTGYTKPNGASGDYYSYWCYYNLYDPNWWYTTYPTTVVWTGVFTAGDPVVHFPSGLPFALTGGDGNAIFSGAGGAFQSYTQANPTIISGYDTVANTITMNKGALLTGTFGGNVASYTDRDENLKQWTMSVGVTEPDPVTTSWYATNSAGGPKNNTSHGQLSTDQSAGVPQSPDNNGHGLFWSTHNNFSDPNNGWRGGWVKVELVAKWSVGSTGFFRQYETNIGPNALNGLMMNYSGITSYTGTVAAESIGDYARNQGAMGEKVLITPIQGAGTLGLHTQWRYFGNAKYDQQVNNLARWYLSNTFPFTLGDGTLTECFKWISNTGANATIQTDVGNLNLGAGFISYVDEANGIGITFNGVLPVVTPVLVSNVTITAVPPPFDFFISTTGSDSNAGTLAAPWALTALNTKRATYKGKKVGIIQGTYNCLSIVGGTYTGPFDTPAFNIAGNISGTPTLIASCDATGAYSRGAAVLNGGVTLANSSACPNGQPLIGSIGAQSAWLTIDGLEIKNSYNRAVSLGFQSGVAQPSTYTQGIIVQNCYIHDCVNNAAQNAGANAALITVYSSDGAILQGNKLANSSSTDGRASGVEIWTSKNCVSQLNTVTNIGCNSNGSGIGHKNSFQFGNTVSFNYIDLSMNGSLYQGCVCVDEDGAAATVNTINNNVLIGNCWIGASIANSSGVPKRKYFNNTLVSPAGQSTGGVITQPINAGQMTFFGNILARTGSTGSRGDMNANTSSFGLLDYNLYPTALRLGATPNGTNNNPATLATTISAWVAQLTSPPAGTESHSLAGTPVFVGGSPTLPAQAYQLAAGSPGKNASTTTGTTGGTATDMGAWGNGATQVGSSF